MSFPNWEAMRQARNEAIIQKLGGRIRYLRTERGLSQQELAHAAELEYSQVNRIELGKINTSISQIAALSQALGLEPKELLDF